ncbi:DUF2256 domain-containing protein [Psychrobacter sp. ENNN9_III]|uniref:DUF2256 domain-containing protein n=1 Tax=Psychrobacter sp. ENNN9_III TaxID=1254334 RepID=UPI0009EC84D8|nr:DUF2256 domain-containing protein [Psychrobacter sp. ENNN9_III]
MQKNLPEKIYPVCLRLFTWCKKWEKEWKQMIYCSERCRRGKGKATKFRLFSH